MPPATRSQKNNLKSVVEQAQQQANMLDPKDDASKYKTISSPIWQYKDSFSAAAPQDSTLLSDAQEPKIRSNSVTSTSSQVQGMSILDRTDWVVKKTQNSGEFKVRYVDLQEAPTLTFDKLVDVVDFTVKYSRQVHVKMFQLIYSYGYIFVVPSNTFIPDDDTKIASLCYDKQVSFKDPHVSFDTKYPKERKLKPRFEIPSATRRPKLRNSSVPFKSSSYTHIKVPFPKLTIDEIRKLILCRDDDSTTEDVLGYDPFAPPKSPFYDPESPGLSLDPESSDEEDENDHRSSGQEDDNGKV